MQGRISSSIKEAELFSANCIIKRFKNEAQTVWEKWKKRLGEVKNAEGITL